ncbi:MAG: HD domain-containing protein [Balneolaceae bacterium]
MMFQISYFEKTLEKFLLDEISESDAAHDIAHIKRVVNNAILIADLESQKSDITIIRVAAWLHDCVILPKNHPDRKKASTLAAKKAESFLSDTVFPTDKIPAVMHAIEAHSYSAGITPRTIEAKIVQDADRLDALGAIGIARCIQVGSSFGANLYNPDDPFSKNRPLNDKAWIVDHFYEKLFNLPDLMHTESAKKIALERVEYMEDFLEMLSKEITW